MPEDGQPPPNEPTKEKAAHLGGAFARLKEITDAMANEKKHRFRQWLIAGICALLVMGVISYLSIQHSPEKITLSLKQFQLVEAGFLASLAIYSAGRGILRYLTPTSQSDNLNVYTDTRFPPVANKDFTISIAEGGRQIQLSGKLAERYLREGPIGGLQESLSQTTEIQEVVEKPYPEIARNRLLKEISALGRRGNINLLIGILTTTAGVAILIFVVFGEPDVDPSQTGKYVMHFILRISIALFIETFAYFFLRMYRNNLDDIKYYQNELTTIETRWSALQAAEKTGEKSVLKTVIEALAKTERNFVLKKGESTLGLERDRLDKNELAEIVREAVAKIKPSQFAPTAAPGRSGSKTE